jgi:hypothetical protein
MNRARWIVLSLLVLATSAYGGSPDSTQRANWSRIPPEFRGWIHTSVSDLPEYPENGDSLMHVKLWPPTRVFDGVTYVQEFSSSESDRFKLNLSSLAEVDSGWDYGSHYVTYSKDGARSGGRGPSYYWRSDSTLAERVYATPEWTRTWGYSERGWLRQYHFSEKVANGFVRGDEWFAEDGSLVACLVGGQHYWRGERKQSEEYRRLLAEFYHWRKHY